MRQLKRRVPNGTPARALCMVCCPDPLKKIHRSNLDLSKSCDPPMYSVGPFVRQHTSLRNESFSLLRMSFTASAFHSCFSIETPTSPDNVLYPTRAEYSRHCSKQETEPNQYFRFLNSNHATRSTRKAIDLRILALCPRFVGHFPSLFSSSS